jgi:hypothetical protein
MGKAEKNQGIIPLEDLKAKNFEDLPKLTTKQEKYADIFCINPHIGPIEAYRRAYNTSESNAAKNYRRVYDDPDFKRYVSIIKSAITHHLGITEPQIIHILTLKARSDITQVVNWDKHGRTTYTPSKDLSESARLSISQFELHEVPCLDAKGKPQYDSRGLIANRKIKITMKDQMKSLELLGTYLGLWKKGDDMKDATRLEMLNKFMEFVKSDDAIMLKGDENKDG